MQEQYFDQEQGEGQSQQKQQTFLTDIDYKPDNNMFQNVQSPNLEAEETQQNDSNNLEKINNQQQELQQKDNSELTTNQQNLQQLSLNIENNKEIINISDQARSQNSNINQQSEYQQQIEMEQQTHIETPLIMQADIKIQENIQIQFNQEAEYQQQHKNSELKQSQIKDVFEYTQQINLQFYCKQKNHRKNQITMMCTNKQCLDAFLICNKCIMDNAFHQDHLDSIKEINQFLNQVAILSQSTSIFKQQNLDSKLGISDLLTQFKDLETSIQDIIVYLNNIYHYSKLTVKQVKHVMSKGIKKIAQKQDDFQEVIETLQSIQSIIQIEQNEVNNNQNKDELVRSHSPTKFKNIKQTKDLIKIVKKPFAISVRDLNQESENLTTLKKKIESIQKILSDEEHTENPEIKNQVTTQYYTLQIKKLQTQIKIQTQDYEETIAQLKNSLLQTNNQAQSQSAIYQDYQETLKDMKESKIQLERIIKIKEHGLSGSEKQILQTQKIIEEENSLLNQKVLELENEVQYLNLQISTLGVNNQNKNNSYIDLQKSQWESPEIHKQNQFLPSLVEKQDFYSQTFAIQQSDQETQTEQIEQHKLTTTHQSHQEQQIEEFQLQIQSVFPIQIQSQESQTEQFTQQILDQLVQIKQIVETKCTESQTEELEQQNTQETQETQQQIQQQNHSEQQQKQHQTQIQNQNQSDSHQNQTIQELIKENQQHINCINLLEIEMKILKQQAQKSDLMKIQQQHQEEIKLKIEEALKNERLFIEQQIQYIQLQIKQYESNSNIQNFSQLSLIPILNENLTILKQECFQKIDHYHEQLTQLNDQNQNLKKNHENLEAELKQKQIEDSNLNARYQQIEQQNVSLKTQVQNIISENKNLMLNSNNNNFNNQSNNSINQQNEENCKIQPNEQLISQLNQLTQQAIQYQQLNQGLQAKNHEFQEEKIRIINEKSQFQNENQKHLELIDNLQNKINQIIQEKNQLSQQIIDLSNQNQELNQQIGNQNQIKKDNIHQQQEQLSKIQNIKELSWQIQQKEVQLAQFQSELTTFSQQNQKLKIQIDILSQQKVHSEKELNDYVRARQEQDQKIIQYQTDLNNIHKNVSEINQKHENSIFQKDQQIAQLQQKIVALNDQVNINNQHNNITQQQQLNLQQLQQIQRLQNQIQNLVSENKTQLSSQKNLENEKKLFLNAINDSKDKINSQYQQIQQLQTQIKSLQSQTKSLLKQRSSEQNQNHHSEENFSQFFKYNTVDIDQFLQHTSIKIKNPNYASDNRQNQQISSRLKSQIFQERYKQDFSQQKQLKTEMQDTVYNSPAKILLQRPYSAHVDQNLSQNIDINQEDSLQQNNNQFNQNNLPNSELFKNNLNSYYSFFEIQQKKQNFIQDNQQDTDMQQKQNQIFEQKKKPQNRKFFNEKRQINKNILEKQTSQNKLNSLSQNQKTEVKFEKLSPYKQDMKITRIKKII